MPRAAAATQELPPVVINQTVQSPAEAPEREKKEKIDFWAYIAGLSPADWRNTVVYVYRTKPVVGVNQREKYLEVLSQPFTIEDLKNRFGGEEFRLIVNRNGKIVQEHTCSIEAAPKYDLSRETPGQQNTNAAVVQTLVEKLTEKNGSGAMDASVERSIDIMGKGFDAAVQRIAAAGGQKNDVLATITILKELGLIGQPQPQNSILETIKVLGTLGLIKTEQADPLKQLEPMLAIFSKLQEFSGSGGSRDWKAEIGTKLLEKAPELIEGITNIGKTQVEVAAQNRARAEAMAAAANTMRTAPAPQPVQPMPAPSPDAILAANAPPASAPISTVAMPEGGAPANPHSLTFEQLGCRRFVEMVFNGDPGQPCMDFLYGLDRRAWEYLITCDAKALKEALQRDPVLAAILQYPHLDEWIAQVLEYSAEIVAASSVQEAQEPAPVTH
jgi:hypothetical protein